MSSKSNEIFGELSKYLLHSDSTNALRFMIENEIDINTLLSTERNETILHRAICPLSIHMGSKNQVEIVEYLLKNDVNQNIKDKDGYTPLYISLSHHSLSNISLLLLDDDDVEIETIDKNESNLIFVAIREYGLTWRPEQKVERHLRYSIIEKLLIRNANLDRMNTYNVSARDWIERCDDTNLNQLIRKYDLKK